MSEHAAFTVDVTLDEQWLKHALAWVRVGGIARVSVVISHDGNARVTYNAAALGGGDEEYMVAAINGDFTMEPAWRGPLCLNP